MKAIDPPLAVCSEVGMLLHAGLKNIYYFKNMKQ